MWRATVSHAAAAAGGRNAAAAAYTAVHTVPGEWRGVAPSRLARRRPLPLPTSTVAAAAAAAAATTAAAACWRRPVATAAAGTPLPLATGIKPGGRRRCGAAAWPHAAVGWPTAARKACTVLGKWAAAIAGTTPAPVAAISPKVTAIAVRRNVAWRATRWRWWLPTMMRLTQWAGMLMMRLLRARIIAIAMWRRISIAATTAVLLSWRWWAARRRWRPWLPSSRGHRPAEQHAAVTYYVHALSSFRAHEDVWILVGRGTSFPGRYPGRR